MAKKEEKKCAHDIWAKGFPFKLIGYSEQEGLALIYCESCEEQVWIEFTFMV